MRVALGSGPVGQLGIDALAVDDQRAQEAYGLAAEIRHQLRGNAFLGLRLHDGIVVYAVLHAQLHIEQAQKVPDLGGRAHRGLATATRQALLDGTVGGMP
ncbi:hypothetical protein SDC9_131381 [bioreactor metagenome]|uniref:Uncharacterized protein n=1 Tax=bioreactor metagenome TaxID=1076179 RepID=A0A645D496_9ZZZZ